MAKTVAETQKLELLDRRFQASLDHPTWRSFRDNAEKCFKYLEGDQWTAAELKELDKRGQPATVNNQVKVTVDRMIGQFVLQRTKIGYKGRNSPEDDPLANLLTDVFLYIKQNNNLEFEERDAATDGFTCGFGCLELFVTFDDDLQPEIRIRHEDVFNIFPDPYSRRYDWNEDATYVSRAKWVDLEEAKELFPSRARELNALFEQPEGLVSTDSFRNDNYIDSNRRRVRLIETEHKVKEKKTILLFRDGGRMENPTTRQIREAEKSGREFRKFDRVESKLMSSTWTTNILFEEKDTKRKNFKWIPYYVHRKKTGEPFSLVLISLTMQDAINKRESKALHLLNSNQKLYERNTVKDKTELANESARPDGQMEVEPGALSNARFQLIQNLELAATQFSMHQAAQQDFRTITGINPDARGEKSEVRSGIGIARKQAMTDLILTPMYDNWRRTRAILARAILELVQQNYTERKVFTITDDAGVSKGVTINGGPGTNIPNEATYDVIVEDQPDMLTTRQEQFALLGQILPGVLPFGPFWAEILIGLSDIRGKDDLIKKIREMSQPPPNEPKISLALQWTELTPDEKSVFAAKMGLSQLAEAEMRAGTDPAHITKAKVELEKAKIKEEGDDKDRETDAQLKVLDIGNRPQKTGTNGGG